MQDNGCTLSAHTTRFRLFGRPVYYGWVLIYAISAAQLVSWGISYYAFTVLLLPMQQDMGWSSAEATGALSLSVLISGAASVWIGRILDARGPRLLMSLGSVLMTALVIAWASVESLPAFYVVWALIGLVSPSVQYEPAFWLAANWFRRRRGLALMVITFFGGLASTVFIPLTTWLNLNYGWRGALWALAGLLALVTIAPHVLLLRKYPEDVGEQVDGDRHTSAPTAQAPATRAPAARAPASATAAPLSDAAPGIYRTRAFWVATIAFALSGLTWSAMSVHLIAFELTRGLDAAFVASAAGAIGVMQVLGRLTLAPLTDRFSPRNVSVLLMLIQAAAFLALLLLPPYAGLLVYVVCFGVGFGTVTPIRAALIADVFGHAGYGRISGAMGLVSNLARAGAPVAVGLAVGVTGYSPILALLTTLCVISALLLTSFRPAGR